MSISPVKKLLRAEQPQISQSEASQIGAAIFKSETSLTVSLRSSRSGFLATSFDKSAHRTPSTDKHLCNGVREQCFLISLNQTSPTNLPWNLLHQPSDTIGQTSEQDLDDTSNESRSGQTMDVVSFPLPPLTTLTPTPPAPARRSMPSTMTPASTQHLVLPSTMTPASTQQLGGGASDTIWPEHVKKRAAERQTLIDLVASSHGLERNPYGPISSPTKPIIQVAGPIHTLIGHRPRSEVQKSFANPSSVMSRYITLRFIYRSEKSIVDDLEKTASRSMTTTTM